MGRHGIIQTFLEKNAMAILLQLVGVVMVLLNLWLARELAPMAQNISGLEYRVQAVEGMYVDHDASLKGVLRIEGIITEINKRLDRIDQRLSTHLGI